MPAGAASRQPRLLAASLSPPSVQAGASAAVTVQATLYDPGKLVSGVRLQLLGQGYGGARDLARLQPQSSDGTTVRFAGRVPLHGQEPGRMALQLVFDLSQRPPGPTIMLLAPVRPLPPAPLSLTVLASAPVPPPDLPPRPPPGRPPTPPLPPLQPPPQSVEKRPDLGLSIVVPPGWAQDAGLREMHGPLNINTFGSHYEHGGFIPAGGATIDITQVPRPEDIDGYIRRQLDDASGSSRQAIQVAGLQAIAVNYTDQFAPELSYRSAAVFVPNGSRLYKFFLAYHPDDPGAGQHERDFEQVLASVRFTF